MSTVEILLYNKVQLQDGSQGIVKYIGNIIGKKGTFYGIDITKGDAKNDGTYKNIKYFDTKKGTKTGRFCKENKIVKCIKTTSKYSFTLGDVVMCTKTKCEGIVKYVGVPAWVKRGKVYYGLELEKKLGTCNGKKKGIQYFTTKTKYGIYVPYKQLKKVNGKQKKTRKMMRLVQCESKEDVTECNNDKCNKKKVKNIQTKTEIDIFLQHFKLLTYCSKLKRLGLDNLQIIHELEDDDINELITDANIKQSHIETLKNAINAVKNGTYNSNKKGKQYKYKYKKIKYYKKLDIKNQQNNKRIIFIGESGVGKTTVINSMCNYLYNVKYNNKYRYKLIYENKNDKTQSQTQNINKYYLNQLPAINGSLTVIDSPGFADTKGRHKDLKIRSKLKKVLKKTAFIDAIYFIVKASETRLDETQNYIFDMYNKLLFDLFGKNIKKNVFIIFTFYDGSIPSALASIKKLKIKYKNSFQINNAGFEFPNHKTQTTHKSFFDEGMKQFKLIFDALLKVQRISTSKKKNR